MPSRIPECIFLLLFTLLVHSYPAPDQTGSDCTLSEDDLASLKTIIQKASSAKEADDLPKDTVEKCPMLKNITEALDKISQDVGYLKKQTNSEEAQSAVDTMQEKINVLVRSRDIFEKDSNKESTRAQGELTEKILSLKVEITKLQQDIRDTTNKMHEAMAELVFQSVQYNITEAVHDYTKQLAEVKLPELLDKLEKNPRVHYGATELLTRIGDEKLIKNVYKTSLERLQKLDVNNVDEKEKGKNILVNLLCFVYETQPTLNDYFGEYRSTLNSVGQKLFPDAWNSQESVKKDVKHRLLCEGQWPSEIIISTG